MRSRTSGPVIVTGNVNSVQQMDPDFGPSLFFQGSGIWDPRFYAASGGAMGLPGTKDYGLFDAQDIVCVDALPAALGAARVVAAATATSGTAMTLVSTEGSGASPLIPVVPFSGGYPQAIAQANKVTPGLCLDFGFATCDTSASSATISNLPSWAWRLMQGMKGQPVIVSGAGSAANTPLVTRIATVPAVNGTTFTVENAAGQTVSGARVGTADPQGLGTAWPWTPAGSGLAMADPAQMLARCLTVTSNNAGDTGWTMTVAGYDMWGQPQTEAIAVTANSTVTGVKAFKYVTSCTPSKGGGGSTTGTLSVGTSDTIGFPLRSDFWEYAKIFYNGALVTASTGYTAAVGTSPATSTTGDSKGRYALQSAADGSKRLVVSLRVQPGAMIAANNLVPATLFGVVPA
jgi:hypothetical protein